MVVVVMQPDRELATHIWEAEEHFRVQAPVAQSPIEALDIAVLDRPSGPDEIQMHAVQISPVAHPQVAALKSGEFVGVWLSPPPL